MSERGLVSVIVIFFNAAQFFDEAIQSVFAQTYDNWELLLVDDGSTDASTTMAKQYAHRHSEKICYLEHAGHANLGMSAARNLGIQHARGEYIAFLDADDVWLPRKLEQQVAILESQPDAAMVYGATQWWYSWNPQNTERDFVHKLGVPPNALIQPPMLLERFLQDEGISPCTCSMLVRREIAERVGGFENIFRGMYEDQVFSAKVCLDAPVYASSECWYRYRQHSDSCVSVTQASGQVSAARLFFLNWLEDYLLTRGCHDTVLWQMLQKELWSHRHPAIAKLRSRMMQIASTLMRLLKSSKNPTNWHNLAYRLIARWYRLPMVRDLRCVQFRRLQPLANERQRGTPVVRYYWAKFLRKHQYNLRGHALEIGTTTTLQEYGGERITQADAMDLTAHEPGINIVVDLSRADHVPADTYDCFLNQFTMHLIADVPAALYHSLRILKPGGVLLVNFPCVDYYFPNGLDMGTGAPLFMHGWFTPIQVENLMRQVGLSEKDYELEICGNLFARIAYQMNLPAEELTTHELEYVDPGHPLLICVRVVKPNDWHALKPVYRDTWLPNVTPAKWNLETGHYATTDQH